jgi:hypothetical protein
MNMPRNSAHDPIKTLSIVRPSRLYLSADYDLRVSPICVAPKDDEFTPQAVILCDKRLLAQE